MMADLYHICRCLHDALMCSVVGLFLLCSLEGYLKSVGWSKAGHLMGSIQISKMCEFAVCLNQGVNSLLKWSSLFCSQL